jgi:uncharacterized protein (DUF2249 family)
MTEQTLEMIELDVRDMIPRERHPRIFATIDALAPGQALHLVNDHDPKPLYYHLMAERTGQVDWAYLQNGPDVWSVRITKRG